MGGHDRAGAEDVLPLAATVLVQEQFGLALNRAGRGVEAERVLLDLLANRGPSSETYGILGRVYKDRWEAALKLGEKSLARGLLGKPLRPTSRVLKQIGAMPIPE